MSIHTHRHTNKLTVLLVGDLKDERLWIVFNTAPIYPSAFKNSRMARRQRRKKRAAGRWRSQSTEEYICEKQHQLEIQNKNVQSQTTRWFTSGVCMWCASTMPLYECGDVCIYVVWTIAWESIARYALSACGYRSCFDIKQRMVTHSDVSRERNLARCMGSLDGVVVGWMEGRRGARSADSWSSKPQLYSCNVFKKL